MKEYLIKYTIKGNGYVTVTANSEEEAKQEFYAGLINTERAYEENDWLDQDAIYDLEWDEEITDVNEC